MGYIKLMKNIADRIDELRAAKGWSIDRLAEEMGTTTNYLAKIRRGERRLNEDTMESLANALGVEPYELLVPKELVMGKIPVWEGVVPAGAPECLEEPTNIEKYVHGQVRNSQCFAKRIKEGSYSMNRVALPGQFILVDPTMTDADALSGKCVLAYYNGECTFKRFHKEPLRLAPESTNTDYDTIFIPEHSDFRIVGWVYGTAGEL